MKTWERLVLFFVLSGLTMLIFTNSIMVMRLEGNTPPAVIDHFRMGSSVAALCVFVALLGRPLVNLGWTVADRFIKPLTTRQ